jgi:hypothetical protein
MLVGESIYCQSCDGNSVYWSKIFDINLHPLPRTEKVSWECYARWSIPYMLLLNVFKDAYDYSLKELLDFVFSFL